VNGLCSKGHPTERTPRGKWVCRTCNRENGRERDRILAQAAKHLGLTRVEYALRHGKRTDTALAVLAGPGVDPRPETCRRGHPRTPENTGWKRAHGRTTRYCTACRRARDADAWAAVAAAADQSGMSCSQWLRLHGRNLTAAAEAARRILPDRPEPQRLRARPGTDLDQARRARDQVRADLEAEWTHVVRLDPDQRDWDGLSVLALCSCGWRETHATPDRARAALKDHAADRPDARHIRGDRVDHFRQETA
jgi:hypothetical protein